nr:WG repeat-containing protein [Paenibacillus dendrobii]
MIQDEKKYGYINKYGEVAIESKFAYAEDFSEGYAPFQNTSKKWGFINVDGDIIIDCKFDKGIYASWGFSEGLVNVVIDGKAGFIDDCGEFIIEPKYEAASPFRNGYSIVKKNDRYGMINKKGEWVVLPSFNSLSHPQDGLIRFEQDYKVGFININSSVVIKNQYHPVSSGFNNGIAVVYDFDQSKYYAINSNGERVFKEDYSSLGYAGEGLYSYCPLNNTRSQDRRVIGLMDKYEHSIVKDIASENFWFSEGLATVKNGKKRYLESFGVLDKSGNWIVEPQYEDIDSFKEGLALVRFSSKKDDTGFIDHAGNIVLKAI